MSTPHDTHTLREELVEEFGKHFPMEFFAHSSFNVMEPGVREWQFKAWQEKETSIALARRERVLNALRTALTTYGDAREAAAREEGEKEGWKDALEWVALILSYKSVGQVRELIKRDLAALTPTDYPANTQTDVTKN